MNAEQKAKELVDLYIPIVTYGEPILEDMYMDEIKQCALIAVDEIIKSNPYAIEEEIADGIGYKQYLTENVNFFLEVRQEIEKL